MTPLPLTIVVAVADNGVIGRDDALPWRLRTDLARFRAITWGKPLVVGRRNWDSIGRPLPGRETVVLTRDHGFAPPGAIVAHDWPGALAAAALAAARLGADEIVVAGGAEIYALALPQAARLRLTEVHAAPPGETRFPPLDRGAFVETWRESHPAGPDDEHPFTFVDLERADGGRRAGDRGSQGAGD